MSTSKAARILRRTLVGGSLVLVLAGCVWLTAQSRDGRPIYWVTGFVALAAVWETSRMGALALVDVRAPLLLAALGVLVELDLGIEQWQIAHEVARAGFQPLAPVSFFDACVVRGYFYAPLVALAAFGIGSLRIGSNSHAAARSLAYVVIGAILVFAVHDVGAGQSRILWAQALLAALALLTALPILMTRAGGLQQLVRVAGLALWIATPLPLLWVAWATWGTSGLVSLLVLAKVGDTFGYYVGSAVGRTHPFPRISPGKTTAGCVGSFVGATAVGGALFFAGVLPATRYGLPGALAAGAIVNLAAQAGDLLESWVKRRVGVKDSSSCFGPSGGLLDQVDSLLLAIPAALATWPWIFVGLT